MEITKIGGKSSGNKKLKTALGELDLYLTYDNYLSGKDVTNILALIKEAGYLSHEEVQSLLDTLGKGFHEMAQILGYRKVEL